jgi:hypothetical protein
MTKLVRIFAASVGGGMALGWGARALKDASDRNRAAHGLLTPRSSSPAAALEGRLSQMEQRLQRIESSGRTPASVNTAAPLVTAEEAEHKLSAAAYALRQNIEKDFRERVRSEAAVAVEQAIEVSLGHRLEQLETTVETHESRMRELRDCSLRTEQNLQRLMAGIERLVSLQSRVPAAEEKPAHHHDSILEKVSA